jgi:CheY-like chemotaxis protein
MEYQPKLNILIVEDDDGAAHLIKTNLRRSSIDAEFHRAKDGEHALEILNEAKEQGTPFSFIDKLIILLDIRMPKLDGTYVLKFIKESEYFSRIPVIMFTTSNREEEVRNCYELGCNFYIKKEVDYKKFSEKIAILASFIDCAEIPVLERNKND